MLAIMFSKPSVGRTHTPPKSMAIFKLKTKHKINTPADQNVKRILWCITNVSLKNAAQPWY